MSIKDKIIDEYIRDLLVRMAHHSTAIEGNTLTLDENISILIKYYIPKEMPEKSYNEVRNYRELFPILLDLLDKKEKEIKVEEIKDYNKIIMANLSDDAGQYKKVANIILGAEFEPVKPYQVPYVMQEWCDNYNFRIKNAKTDEEKVEIILDQHIKFERIHPFGDGNGRTGRLLIIDSCLRENLVPIIIPKSTYYYP
jgi:Fic family protein